MLALPPALLKDLRAFHEFSTPIRAKHWKILTAQTPVPVCGRPCRAPDMPGPELVLYAGNTALESTNVGAGDSFT